MNAPRVCVDVRHVPSNFEGVDGLAARKLDPMELLLISPRANQKRRTEFVYGRLAARAAVSQLLGSDGSAKSFKILREGNGPTGRPIVEMNQSAPIPQVSLSHTDGIAVAAATFGKVGIDLASIEPQTRSFVEETFSPFELEQWAIWLGFSKMDARTITSAFAAKEAALKWLGTGFATPLRAIEIFPLGIGKNEHPSPYQVRTLLFPIALIQRGLTATWHLVGRYACLEDRISILIVEQWSAMGSQPHLVQPSTAKGDQSS